MDKCNEFNKTNHEQSTKVAKAKHMITQGAQNLTTELVKELCSHPNPPEDCQRVMKCMLILLKDEKEDFTWVKCQTLLQDPDFINKVKSLDIDNMDQSIIDRATLITKEETFNFDAQKKNGGCTAFLTLWAENVVIYVPEY